MEPSDHANLINLLISNFPNSLAVYNPNGSNKGGSDGFNTNVTLDHLWATKARIIVFYADVASVSAHNIIWPNEGNPNLPSAISSPWPNKADFNELKETLDKELPYTGSPTFVLQCQITPDKTLVLLALAGATINSLGAIADIGNPQIIQWLHGWGTNAGINVVIADWITGHPKLISTILAMNGIAIASEESPSASLEAKMIAETATVSNTALTSEGFAKGLEEGTIKLADIIDRTHAQAFQVHGQNPSDEDVRILMELHEFVKVSEVGKSKLILKPDIVQDPTKLEEKKDEKTKA
ncbi:hypothetical protein DL93DRAFT_2079382 [Clavulina sp. PMI_390]|nr:hypothetical protein DL93DRAFT_2079382 [Clavulina sp. PMI_390]